MEHTKGNTLERLPVLEGLTQFKFLAVSMSEFRNEGLGKEPRAPSAGDHRAKESISIQCKTCQQDRRDNGGERLEVQVTASAGKCGIASFSDVAHGSVFLCDNLLTQNI